ncbi:hypothetical protein ACIPZF_13045 [Pseudomonas sp. NPDC089752]|uniref:hypothetical protein n=1 Tax=Pseudomonas sp. NPDC089752 TaxID=3364472 RepID=UPI0038282719
MIGLIPELLRSLDLQPALDKVQGGEVLDYAQYSVLRDSVDAKFHYLLGNIRHLNRRNTPSYQHVEDELRNLQDACLRVSHLLQTSCLALRRLELDYHDQRLAREALEGQQAYMQACLRRSLASFDKQA